MTVWEETVAAWRSVDETDVREGSDDLAIAAIQAGLDLEDRLEDAGAVALRPIETIVSEAHAASGRRRFVILAETRALLLRTPCPFPRLELFPRLRLLRRLVGLS